jgi:DNA-binding MltR family transcriptional regulator
MKNLQAPEPAMLPNGIDRQAAILAETLNKESDSGCAIIGAEITSSRLESLLRAFFRRDPHSRKQAVDPLFTGYGPLSTFSARIQMAYAMYLIPKIIRDRGELIRKIRDHFGHSSSPARFCDKECRTPLHLLATGKFKPLDSVREVRHVLLGDRKLAEVSLTDRYNYICAVAQTVTIIERLETLVRNSGDIRPMVLTYEKIGTFENDLNDV